MGAPAAAGAGIHHIVSLNACLLPSHLRWIFRAHRGPESLATATARVAAAVLALDRATPGGVRVVHLQEVFHPHSHQLLAQALSAGGLKHATPHTRCGLVSFSREPLAVIETRERSCPPFTPKGWVAVRVACAREGARTAVGELAEVHVNCHFASEIDGAHAARLDQAREVGSWVRAMLAPPRRCRDGSMCGGRSAAAQGASWEATQRPGRVVVVGDVNEPDGPRADLLARAMCAVPAGSLPVSYSWLGGLVQRRLDRCYVYDDAGVGRDPREADEAGSRGPGPSEHDVLGVEVAGRVVDELDDVSDHWAVAFTLPSRTPAADSPWVSV